MPIHIPGSRDARGRRRQVAKRNVVAVLSLTAMVDLFTVLAVFLLQNYASTGEVIHIPERVQLPDAIETTEIKPSTIVSISNRELRLNDAVISDFRSIKNQTDWVIKKLKVAVEDIIAQGQQEKEQERASIENKIRSVMVDDSEEPESVDVFRKVTIQADKEIDFLTIKKVMYTLTEAGVYEINFAVIKKSKVAELSI